MSKIKKLTKKNIVKLYHTALGQWCWTKLVKLANYQLVQKAMLKALRESGHFAEPSEKKLGKKNLLQYVQAKKHVLIIFPYYGTNASWTYIQKIAIYFKEFGYIVHGLQYNSDPNPIQDTYFDFIYNIRSKNPNFHRWNVHPELPAFSKNKIDDWIDENLLQKIEELDRYFHFDIVVCNYVFLSATLLKFTDKTKKILVTHDIFADRNFKLASNGVRPSHYSFSCSELEEIIGLRRADIVMNIQEEDSNFYADRLDDKKILTLPYIPDKKYLSKDASFDKSLAIGYLASGHMPNIVAIRSLLDFKLPSNVKIKIAGSVCNQLYDLSTHPNVELFGCIDKLEDFYSSCDLMINPDMVESGLKIKCVEALAFGCPLICTKAASIGLPVIKEYHKCEDISQMVKFIKLVASGELSISCMAKDSRNVYDTFVEKYSPYNEIKKIICGEIEKNYYGSIANPKVSVIMPIYKVEKYLDQAICSVLTQTLKEIELIAVDDGSPDKCGEIIDRYSQSDKRIKVIHKENGGYGSAVNAGLDLARGQYIAILEPDDWIETEMLEVLYKAAIQNQCDVVKSGFFKHFPNGELLFNIPTFHKPIISDIWQCLANDLDLVLMESSIWTALYKREFLKENQIVMFDLKGGSYQDVNWKFDVLSSTKQICLVNKAFYHYRVMTQSSSSKSGKNPLNMFVNYEHIKSRLIKKGVFKDWENMYYAHFYLDTVFHYNRLNESALKEFLQSLSEFIKNAEKDGVGLEKIVFPDEMSFYVGDQVLKVYKEAKAFKR